ncbi:MAG: DHA2 family efflux MFS transporter permease subunit [Paludibaculum sp.]
MRKTSPWTIALVVMLATFMEVLDTSVANVALPHIAGSLSASVDESTWVLTSYLVSNAVILPLSGWLSALFGRKRFYMACVLLFTISSLMCGFALSLGMLILFRVLQGVGGGALQPVSQAIVRESFPADKQGMGMAIYGMGVVLAPVVGPTLGGWITDNFSWRWIFFINIPVGLLSLTLTNWLIHDPPYLERISLKESKLDFLGLGLLTLGLASLEIVLDEGQRNDWFGSTFIVRAAVVAVIGLVGVVWWELRQKNPVVDFRLLKERNFAISTVAMFTLGFVLYGSTLLIPLFLQQLMGYTATLSGQVLSPGGLVILFMMPVVGMLLRKFEARRLVAIGFSISAIGLWMMTRLSLDADFGTFAVARAVQSLGLAFLFVPINAMAFNFIPKEKTSYATGIINLARNVGGSAGIAMASTLLARRAQFHQNRLVDHLTPLDGAYRSMLDATQHVMQLGGASAADAAQKAFGMMYGLTVKNATLLAFIDGFWVLAVLFAAAVPLTFFMKKSGVTTGPIHVD